MTHTMMIITFILGLYWIGYKQREDMSRLEHEVTLLKHSVEHLKKMIRERDGGY